MEFPNLWDYCHDLYQQPGVREWCRVDHVKQLYYAGLPELNPSRIVPVGPDIDFGQPHTRDRQHHAEAESCC
ncbi:MAG: hypothetical protein AAFY26_17795 [Cyanobacteria bacterium J06638_22]